MTDRTDKAGRITTPEPETCSNCRYLGFYLDRLLCRRYPPSPKHNSGFNGVADTRAEYWCGEHKPATAPTPQIAHLPA